MKNWSFGMDNDNLVNLVLAGKKIATTCLYNEENIPTIGEESIIHFDNEKDACIVKTKEYHVMKFKDMTEDLAKLEGEGDLSLDYWRNVHTEFFKSFYKEFNDETEIIFEIFEVTRNLVQERLQLGTLIARKNKDILGPIKDIYEVNAGFNNTLFSVNNKYIIKVCTNKDKENTFDKEYEFYTKNKDNKSIPKLYTYDTSKKHVPYVYEIMEQLPGKTLYYYYYKMTEKEKENTIKKIVEVVKELHENTHQVNTNPTSTWLEEIKSTVTKNLQNVNQLFTKKEYKMIQKSLNLYDKYLSEDVQYALLHNDLHFDNILYNRKKVKIIDFNDTLIAPIDYEFRIIYQMQQEPWRWADIVMDPYQKPKDYKNIFTYVKKYYQELSNIKYLEERQIIYKILGASKDLQKYKNKDIIDKVINCSKLLIERDEVNDRG